MAAIGGALVLGALPRIRRAPHWRHSATMAAGLAILANSRAFEGLVFSLAIAVALLAWMLGKNGPPRAVSLGRIVLPLALLLALTGAALMVDFARVTGDPWLPPYVLYREAMTVAPHFLWQRLGPPPLYDNQEMRNFYVRWETGEYLFARQSILADLARKIGAYWHFYLGPLLTIPLVALRPLWRDPRTRQLLLIAAAFAAGLAGEVWHNVHYAAPATGLVILIVILAMRRLRLWRWRQRPVGVYLVLGLPTACAALLLIQIAAGRVPNSHTVQAGWRWPAPAGILRAHILHQLESTGGKHLVLVRYSLQHHPGDEWVYNGADIDGSTVVWARELDRESNARLLQYFRGRRVWLVEPDAASARLQLYSQAAPRPMPFVQLGAPGIAVLDSVDEIRRKVQAQVAVHETAPLLNCDVWNFYFTEATGVWGPDATNGCYAAGDRAQLVTFDHWFAWLQRQR
jgi:hypothetical protein